MDSPGVGQTFAGAFGANVADVRSRRGLSQEELGFQSKLHRTAVGQIERGERAPRLESAVKIAAALDVPLGTLVEGIGWKPPVLSAGGFDFAGKASSK